MFRPQDIDFSKLFDESINLKKIIKDVHEQYKKELESLRNTHAKTIELNYGDEVKIGDIINIDVKGGSDRFDKKGIVVTLGLGFYALDLEEKLAGYKVGYEGEFDFVFKKEELRVSVKINSGKRNIPAELSDEFIKKISNNEISSMKEYEDQWHSMNLRMQIEEEFVNKIYMKMATELAEKSKVEIKRETIERLEESFAQWRDEEARMANGDVLSVYKKYFGDDIKDENEGAARYIDYLKKQALINDYAKELFDFDGCSVDEAEYNSLVEGFAEENNLSIEEVKNNTSFDDYCISRYQEHLSREMMKVLDRHIESKADSEDV